MKDKVSSAGSKISRSPDIGLDIIYSEHTSGRVKDRLQAKWLWARVEQTVTKLDPFCMNSVLRLLYTLQLQRVCRQPVKAEGWIHYHSSTCGVFGEKSDITTGSSRVFLPFTVNIHLPLTPCGPGSVVATATGYGLDGPRTKSRCRRDFPHLSRPALGSTQPPVQRAPVLSPG